MTLDLRGTTALVTGASAGIGAEFARALAARGADLVLVARREDRLQALADELAAAHHVSTATIAADLGTPGAGRTLAAELAGRGLEISTLINNAGFGTYGTVGSVDPDRVASEIQLNVGTLVELTAALMPQLLSARGIVVNVASNAAFQPVPGMAVYAATKSFVLSFTEALWVEAKGSGLRVLALCPGGTTSEFAEVAGTDHGQVEFGPKQTAAEVVGEAMQALDNGRGPTYVSGRRNRALARLGGLVPRRLELVVLDRMTGRPRLAANR